VIERVVVHGVAEFIALLRAIVGRLQLEVDLEPLTRLLLVGTRAVMSNTDRPSSRTMAKRSPWNTVGPALRAGVALRESSRI